MDQYSAVDGGPGGVGRGRALPWLPRVGRRPQEPVSIETLALGRKIATDLTEGLAGPRPQVTIDRRLVRRRGRGVSDSGVGALTVPASLLAANSVDSPPPGDRRRGG